MATALLRSLDLLPDSLSNMKTLDLFDYQNTEPSSKDHDCRFLDVPWKDETVVPMISEIGFYAQVLYSE